MMVSISFTIRNKVDSFLTTDYWIDATYESIGRDDWILRRAKIDRVVLWMAKQGHCAQVSGIDATAWVSNRILCELTDAGFSGTNYYVLVAAECPNSKDKHVRLIDLILNAAEDDAEYRERRRAAADHVPPDAEDMDYERIRNGDVPMPLRLRPEWNE
jgi:hypothetical protein